MTLADARAVADGAAAPVADGVTLAVRALETVLGEKSGAAEKKTAGAESSAAHHK